MQQRTPQLGNNSSSRSKGRLTSWNDEKGFGFIAPNGGGQPVFLHIKAFANRARRPGIGQLVTYALTTDPRGRPCATQATLAGDRLPAPQRHRGGALAVLGAGGFLALLGVAVIAGKLPPWVAGLYLAVSALTFISYALDKSAARKGRWRTAESTLHLLALGGGWPGALIAQQLLRHKSKKQAFRARFWMTVLLNCGALLWLYSPLGDRLQSFVSGHVSAVNPAL